jgi:serine/threonine protein kinase
MLALCVAAHAFAVCVCASLRGGIVVCAQLEAFEREVALLQDLKHPNIVRYFGTSRSSEKLLLFLEFASGGSIASALARYVCPSVRV